MSDLTPILVRQLRSELTACQHKLTKFAESMEKDPAYALSWAEDVCLAAAKVSVYGRALRALEAGVDPETLKHTHISELIVSSQYNGANSTSMMSNVMKINERMAMGQLVDLLKSI